MFGEFIISFSIIYFIVSNKLIWYSFGVQIYVDDLVYSKNTPVPRFGLVSSVSWDEEYTTDEDDDEEEEEDDSYETIEEEDVEEGDEDMEDEDGEDKESQNESER